MIDAIIKITVPPDKRKEVLQTFKAILGPIRREQGCISCHCYMDIEAENSLFLREEWNTREELDAHLRSIHFGVLIGAMKILNREPDISFNTIAFTAGEEAVKAVRS